MKKNLKYILFTLSTMLIITNVKADCVVCGADTIPIPEALPNFVSKLIMLVQILVPVILIVTGMIRYAKVVFSGEDKVATETNRSFIRSAIAAVSIFLIISIVKFVFNAIDKTNAGGEYDNIYSESCISCFINGDCETTFCPERDEDLQEYKDRVLKTAKKGCSDYGLDECPDKAKDGIACTDRAVMKGSSALKCAKACKYLGTKACSERMDCEVKENKCVKKETKSCSDYSVKKCPNQDSAGILCTNKGVQKGSTKKKCMSACSNLSISECSNREDCKAKENKCVSK